MAAVKPSQLVLYVFIAAGGAAALSWEVIWQLKAALSLGVSALGTAITVASTMGGMTVGSLVMCRWLRKHPTKHPLRLYGLLELTIGLAGLTLIPAFRLLETIDSSLYVSFPNAAPIWHLVGIAVIMGPPTLAMGATNIPRRRCWTR